jgi:hypothetical protein
MRRLIVDFVCKRYKLLPGDCLPKWLYILMFPLNWYLTKKAHIRWIPFSNTYIVNGVEINNRLLRLMDNLDETSSIMISKKNGVYRYDIVTITGGN